MTQGFKLVRQLMTSWQQLPTLCIDKDSEIVLGKHAQINQERRAQAEEVERERADLELQTQLQTPRTKRSPHR